MPTERLPLDAVISSTELSGATVANLDEDPDSHDANWAVASADNVSTDIHCSFGTPGAALVAGAEQQEFRVAVRKYSTNSNNPTGRIELWEAGVLVRAGGENSVTAVASSADVISLRWNATEITDAADVQIKVFGTKTGGGPSVRNAMDIGAIEWNAKVESSGIGAEYQTQGNFGVRVY